MQHHIVTAEREGDPAVPPKRRWPRLAVIVCAVIFGPSVLIGLFGPMFAPDASDGSSDGVYLVGVVEIAAAAIAVGVVLVLSYWIVRWLVRLRRRFDVGRRNG